jgi:ABC-type transport system involved in cytochrome c biogenesis ATPase subunit
MYIKSLAVKNTLYNWELEKVVFDYNLTLLVGTTGAGKTQILRAVENLGRIIGGAFIGGFEWEVVVELDNGKEYQWSGAFHYEDDEKGKIGEISFPQVREEYLIELGQEDPIISRDGENTYFNGNKMPKLNRSASAIALFGEEHPLKDIGLLLHKIVYRNNAEQAKPLAVSKYLDERSIVVKDVEELKSSTAPSLVKYYIAQQKNLPVWYTLLKNYQAIFPQVKHVHVSKRLEGDQAELAISVSMKGVGRPIEQGDISSGMLRMFLLLVDLYFLPDGTTLLVDEIENSLGVNCLDEYVHSLQHANRNLQIIATSHHPYIINNIPHQQWKIVQRNANSITARNAEEYAIGESRQENFIQLMRLFAQPA